MPEFRAYARALSAELNHASGILKVHWIVSQLARSSLRCPEAPFWIYAEKEFAKRCRRQGGEGLAAGDRVFCRWGS
jgi:hypothetical protein